MCGIINAGEEEAGGTGGQGSARENEDSKVGYEGRDDRSFVLQTLVRKGVLRESKECEMRICSEEVLGCKTKM